MPQQASDARQRRDCGAPPRPPKSVLATSGSEEQITSEWLSTGQSGSGLWASVYERERYRRQPLGCRSSDMPHAYSLGYTS